MGAGSLLLGARRIDAGRCLRRRTCAGSSAVPTDPTLVWLDMPNFHPRLVALIAPQLGPAEEIWAVYPGRTSLIATSNRLFVVGRHQAVPHPLTEFEALDRPRTTMALLKRWTGTTISIPIDPGDEHGLQALTVIGLLVALTGRARRPGLEGPAPPSVAPKSRRRPYGRPRIGRWRQVGGHPHVRPAWRFA